MSTVFSSPVAVRNNTIAFQMAPTHVAYANTLRRLCMTGVETVGFRADILTDGSTSDVKILANSTPMTNEMLAHRVGLIPIHVKDPLSWNPEDYKFSLDVSNDTDKVLDVCAGDFKIQKRRGEGSDEFVPVPNNEFFKPFHGQTALIATLKPKLPGAKEEEIRIIAKATVGIGRENARFIPTTQCAYSYTRDDDEAHIKEVRDEWLTKSKKITDIAALEKDEAKMKVIMNEFNTLQINRCYKRDPETGEANSFDFTVETTGVLSPQYVVLRALENGAKMCQRFTGESLPDDVTVQLADSRLRGTDFIFQRQDHTLGHLIQAWIDQHMVGTGDVTFVGYDIPHPLRDEMVIRIGTADGQEDTARRVLRQAMDACSKLFLSWRDQWLHLTNPQAFAAAAATVGTSAPKVSRAKILRRPTKA